MNIRKELADLKAAVAVRSQELVLPEPRVIHLPQHADAKPSLLGNHVALWRAGARGGMATITRMGSYADAVVRGIVPAGADGYTDREREIARRLARTPFKGDVYGGVADIPWELDMSYTGNAYRLPEELEAVA